MLIWLRTCLSRSTFSVNLLMAGLLPHTEQLWEPLIKTWWDDLDSNCIKRAGKHVHADTCIWAKMHIGEATEELTAGAPLCSLHKDQIINLPEALNFISDTFVFCSIFLTFLMLISIKTGLLQLGLMCFAIPLFSENIYPSKTGPWRRWFRFIINKTMKGKWLNIQIFVYSVPA